MSQSTTTTRDPGQTMRFSRLTPLVAALCSATASASAQQASGDSTKTQLVVELLNLLHAPDQAILAIEISLPAQRAANPRIPAAFWDRFLERAKANREQFASLLIPIYARHLELGDLQALLAFYRSPAGRHFLVAQTPIIQESLLAGQQWGKDLGLQIDQELQAEEIHPQVDQVAPERSEQDPVCGRCPLMRDAG